MLPWLLDMSTASTLFACREVLEVVLDFPRVWCLHKALHLAVCQTKLRLACLSAEMCFKVAPDFSNVVAAWRAAVALATEELQQGRK